MATVKLLLYDYYKKKDSNKLPLYIRIIHNRKPKYIALGITVNPEKDWDAERLRVKKSYPNATRVNNFIVKKLAEAEKIALDLEEKKKRDEALQRIIDKEVEAELGDFSIDDESENKETNPLEPILNK